MSASFRSPLCVALDTPDVGTVEELARATEPYVGLFKIGLTTYTALGPTAVGRVARRAPVFLDLKLHDIPAQVSGAVRAAEGAGAALVTVHASGGGAMVRAAADAGDAITVLAVTVLTSLDDDSLTDVGMSGPTEKAVLRLAELALGNGAGGLVCSPLEVGALRSRFGTRNDGGPLLVVPGIRPTGADPGDQRRTLDPRAAIDAGADVIVVGRPITGVEDPAAAAASIASDIRP
ncbi:MAG: orotidine-5'-phosphate decarboxylase [Actinomycetota bacterium]